VAAFYAFARRQWLKLLRNQSIHAASVFVANAQAFDASASASVVFIQEVELVSRGYRMLVSWKSPLFRFCLRVPQKYTVATNNTIGAELSSPKVY
jgi:hypothetical protein